MEVGRVQLAYYDWAETSFFSFIWNSLFPAIKQSVGVTAAKEERIQNTTRGIGKTLKGVGGVLKKIEQKREAHKLIQQEKRKDRKKRE